MNWCGYIGVENLNLTPPQRLALMDALEELGPASFWKPNKHNHQKIRPDNEAMIFEAEFDIDTISVPAFKNLLGNIFGVSPDSINHATDSQSFGGGTSTVITFSRIFTNYARAVMFGGIGASWQESGDECRGYLKLYDWDGGAQAVGVPEAASVGGFLRRIFSGLFQRG